MGKPRLERPLDTTTEVETPEHVRFRYQVAGPGRRLYAYLIDVLIRVAIIVVFWIVAGIGGLVGDLPGLSMGVVLLVWFVVEWFYYVLWEVAWSGRTPGKRVFSLRVLSDTGHPLRVGQSLIRNLLRSVDFWPAWQPIPAAPFLQAPTYVVGGVTMGRDPRFRRLGDLAAGTMVVVEERVFVEQALVIHPPPTARELASLPQRLPLSGDEIEALELFLRRAHKLPPLRVHELAEMVAPTFGARVGIGSIRDPFRFLQVLFARARGVAAAPEHRPPPPAPQGPAAFGSVGFRPHHPTHPAGRP